jgi:hypothetical protein
MNSPSTFARFIHEKGAREDQKVEMLEGDAKETNLHEVLDVKEKLWRETGVIATIVDW